MSLKELRFSSQDNISFKINNIIKIRLVNSLMSRYFKLNIHKRKIKELESFKATCQKFADDWRRLWYKERFKDSLTTSTNRKIGVA